MKRFFLSSIASVSLIATPGFAESPPPASSGTGFDPNEKICENIAVIGSRLAKKRVCATRAEWEERNRQDREAVSQAQKQIGGPCTSVANKNIGAPSC